MKKLFNLLALIVIGTFALTSCNKDDGFDDTWYQKELARIDSTNEAQAPILKAYAEEHLGDGLKLDTASGIYFEELEQAPENSFDYINSYGQLNRFMAKVTYTGRIVPSGDIFQTTDEVKSFTSENIIEAWRFAFYPKSVEIDNQVRRIGGLTDHGLNKGSIIRFIAPSTLCYDNQANGDIPANSPLDFIINVDDVLY